MPLRPYDDTDEPRRPRFDAAKVAQVAVFVVGLAVVGLVVAYR